jgi:hypothetical protein
MSPDKTEQLAREFPELLIGMTEPLTQNLMGFGFEYGDGWFDLTAELLGGLEEIRKTEAPNLKLLQAKEKFGMMRVYLSSATKEAHDLVDKIEGISAYVCEDCGDLGKLVSVRGWIQSLCIPCQKEREK